MFCVGIHCIASSIWEGEGFTEGALKGMAYKVGNILEINVYRTAATERKVWEKTKKMKVLYKVSNAALIDTQFKPICLCMYH